MVNDNRRATTNRSPDTDQQRLFGPHLEVAGKRLRQQEGDDDEDHRCRQDAEPDPYQIVEVEPAPSRTLATGNRFFTMKSAPGQSHGGNEVSQGQPQ